MKVAGMELPLRVADSDGKFVRVVDATNTVVFQVTQIPDPWLAARSIVDHFNRMAN